MQKNNTEDPYFFLKENLAAVQRRVEEACLRAGRPAEEITLIAVSKTHPIPIIKAAHNLGMTAFGENRTTEIKEKERLWPAKWKSGDVAWHFIGSLQRKNAKFITEHSDLFHGLDSVRLAEALSRRAEALDRVLPCLIQINISGETTKSGVKPDELPDLIQQLKRFKGISVVGLMGMAAYSVNPEAARPAFRILKQVFNQINENAHNSDKLTILSMGMSNDFEVAIEEGATHIRVGTAIFGNRT